ncbi:ATP synthase F1 subunit epsilon [Candidatus Dojkabacteria bacterium]|uniref:ATP synthase epsilon chain n=1 Tax=Candidatus Dojkabacteria bacterium TaxID=2099670 RepID=A0A5C7J6S1_9BACT|nr:MAG: ATP synthase F1 subunit epsilon [Candidatus Dojkabacteria bacterium]
MNFFHVKLVTPEGLLLDTEVTEVTLPILEGEVTILAEHIPYIGALRAGEALLKTKEGKREEIALSGGFVEFDNNILTILADTAERAEDIDIARAEEAKRRAEELRNQAVDMSEEEYARLAAAIEKEFMRIKVARKHASHRGPHILSSSE